MKYIISVFLFLSIISIASESNILVKAVCANRVKKVNSILKKHLTFDINSLVDEKNNPLLFRAISDKNFEMFEVLVNSGKLDINKQNNQGKSILDHVYSLYNTRGLRFNPVHEFETSSNKDFIKVFEILLANKDIVVNEGVLSDAYQKKCLDFVELLLSKKNINPNVKTSAGVPLLTDVYNFYTSVEGEDKFFELMINLLHHKKIDINAADSENETLLHKICYNESLVLEHDKNYEVLQMVLENKHIDVNVLDKKEKTPLHKAVFLACCAHESGNNEKYQEQIKIIEALLENKKINLSLTDCYEKTAYDLAAEKDNREIMQLLSQNNSPITFNPEEYRNTDQELQVYRQEIINAIGNSEKLSQELSFYFNSRSIEYKKGILSEIADQEAKILFLNNLFIELNNENINNSSKKLGFQLRHVIDLGVAIDNEYIENWLFEIFDQEEINYFRRFMKYAFFNGYKDFLSKFFSDELLQKLEEKNSGFALKIKKDLSKYTQYLSQ